MIRIDIRDNIADVQAQMRGWQQDLQDRAINAALNKTADKGKAETTRQITAEFAIKAADVRPRISITRASKKGTSLEVKLQAFGRGRGRRSMNVIHFLERKVTLAEGRRRAKAGTRNQLFFQIKRHGGKKPIAGAFIGNKGRTVFERVGKARLPIRPVETIDVPQMFNTQRINNRVVIKMLADFPIELQRAIRHFGSR